MCLAHKIGQPIAQLRIVGGGKNRDVHIREECNIVNALVCGTVAGHQPRAVHSEQHIQLHQIDIMDDLVVGALEKCGIDGDHGQQPLAGQARRKRDSVFLRHADVKETPGMAVLEEVQAGAVLHGGGDAAQPRLVVAQICQRTAERRREGILR